MVTSDTGPSGSIQFTSWNIKGINHPIKRSRVFTHLKSLRSDIIFLQETHLHTSEHLKLSINWIGQIFSFTSEHRSRGTAILIRKGIHFVATSVISDDNGRFIIVAGKPFGLQVVLANIYGLNWDNPQFFTCFIAKLPDLHSHHLSLGGDFNCVLHPGLDKSRPRPDSSISKSGKVLLSFINLCKLSDPRRRHFSTTKQYSFFSSAHQSYSCIDFFLLDSGPLHFVKDCKYQNIVISTTVQFD